MRRRHSPWRGARCTNGGDAALRVAAGCRHAALPLLCGAAYGPDERKRMNLTLKRTPGLYVVGFMASGKSTIGRALAHRLGWSFFDSDEEIEAAEKTSIANLF